VFFRAASVAVSVIEEDSIDHTAEFEIIEVVKEEGSFTEIMPSPPPFKIKMSLRYSVDSFKENGLAGSQEVI
jgi:hypothetical protein